MIFVTTGHQTPFDRLVRLVDEWNKDHPDVECFAQIGDGIYEPTQLDWTRWLLPREFDSYLRECSMIVGHAGTGTILQALQHGKPVLVLARRSSLGETRNDHQIATAREFSRSGHVRGTVDEEDFLSLLENHHEIESAGILQEFASETLLQRIQQFIQSG